MTGPLRQLGKHSLTFGFGDSLKGLIGFLLIPIYTRYLTPTDYGKLALIAVTLSIVSGFAAQGMTSAFFRSYAFLERENRDLDALISTSYFYLLLSALIALVILITFSESYSQFLLSTDSDAIFIKIGAFIIFSQTVATIPFAFLRARLESLKYVSLTLIQFALQCFLNIFFIVVLGLGVTGILLGNAISTSLVAIAASVMIAKYLVKKVSIEVLKELLTFGWPIVFVSLSMWIMNVTDRFLLEKLGTTHELGLYSLGSTFASILLILFVKPFRKVWGAYLFQVATDDHAQQAFRSIATYFFLLVCLAGTTVVIWIQPVIRIVAGKEFWDAATVVTPLVYANVLNAMILMFTLGMHIEKKTKFLSYIIGIGAIVNIALNLILIPEFGMLGAAFSSILAYLLIDLLAYRASQKLFHIPFDIGRLSKISLTFLFVTFLASMVRLEIVLLDLMFRMVLMVLFFGLLIILKFWRPEELLWLRKGYHLLKEKKGLSNKLRLAAEFIKG